MTVTIYHDPACGTSRDVLAMIRQAPQVKPRQCKTFLDQQKVSA